MAYCTYTEVQSEFKDIEFTASTSVTSTDVTAFIAMEDALIDARIGLKYAVPVTGGASSLLLLKRISLGLVVGKIKNLLVVKSGDSKADQGGPGDALIKQSMALLQMLVDEDIILAGAAPAAVTSAVKSYLSNGGGDYTPVFDVEKTQW